MRRGLRSTKATYALERSPGTRGTAHRTDFHCDFVKNLAGFKSIAIPQPPRRARWHPQCQECRLTRTVRPAHQFPMEYLGGRAQHTSTKSVPIRTTPEITVLQRSPPAGNGTRASAGRVGCVSDAGSDVAHAQALHIAR
ncbi:hypothetical protein D9611_005980 [Ephemerocybe angulata]|uniref:Uncharacterized protein n=1 Tax=Ephemerocybe angulata TaxID=980116 RepID=A0A8H5FLR0_9AGAR|nr:hypothetical protein D9611_005980 [Tulosesus angulatus]